MKNITLYKAYKNFNKFDVYYDNIIVDGKEIEIDYANAEVNTVSVNLMLADAALRAYAISNDNVVVYSYNGEVIGRVDLNLDEDSFQSELKALIELSRKNTYKGC